jgi:hypothetical protein
MSSEVHFILFGLRSMLLMLLWFNSIFRIHFSGWMAAIDRCSLFLLWLNSIFRIHFSRCLLIFYLPSVKAWPCDFTFLLVCLQICFYFLLKRGHAILLFCWFVCKSVFIFYFFFKAWPCDFIFLPVCLQICFYFLFCDMVVCVAFCMILWCLLFGNGNGYSGMKD